MVCPTDTCISFYLDYPESGDGAHTHRITDSILIAFVVLLSMIVVVLFIVLLRTRRKDPHHPPPAPPHHHPEPVLTAMDVKLRPKSTNVELQGVCPLPSPPSTNTDCTIGGGKLGPWQTEEQQGSAGNKPSSPPGPAVVTENLDPSKVPELYQLILEGERTGKPLLDLQSLADVDPNSFRNSV